jgi:replicative DNA helicase
MADAIAKIPPQNIEAEQSVLGSLLLDKDALIKVADFLKPEDFYRDDHKEIYQAILKLYEKRRQIDVLTLTDILEKEKKSMSEHCKKQKRHIDMREDKQFS